MKKTLHLMMCCLTKGMKMKVSLNVFAALLVIFSFAKDASAQSYPFPQNVDYSYGLAKPNGASDAHVQAAYQHWKTNFVTTTGACGFQRVIFDYYPGEHRGKADGSRTVSEGIAYGMLIAAYMGDDKLFNNLWGYYKHHRNENGVMHWMIESCQVIGQNGASDAELDVAMALIVASHQWQSDQYLNDAKMMIRIIRQHQFDGDVLKPGDKFGGNNLVCPSYFSPAYYKVFKDYDTGYAQFWENAINKAYQIIEVAGGTSGLVPDWCTATGQVSGAATQYEDQGKNFIFDAIRTPFRAGIDYLWHGTPAAKAYNEKITTWLMNTHPSSNSIGSKYGTRLNNNEGNVLNASPNNTFLGCFAVGVMGTDVNQARQNYLNSLYQTHLNLQPGYGEYFNASFKMLTLLVLTGNFYLPPPDQCESPDLRGDATTETLSLCSGTITLDARISGRTYVWRRNGTTINGQTSKTLSVTQPGSYEVIATDPSGCVRRDNITVVEGTVKADFVAKPGPGSILLENTSTGGISGYTWTLDGADAKTDKDVVYDNLTNGSYVVKLVVDNAAYGCAGSSIMEKTVVVGDGVGVAVDDFEEGNDRGIYGFGFDGIASPPKKKCAADAIGADCPDYPCGVAEMRPSGTPQAWGGFGFTFETEDAPYDLSTTPYVSVKLWASKPVKVGVKLIMNATPSVSDISSLSKVVELTTEPQVFTLDFSDVKQGWDNVTEKNVTVAAWNKVNGIQFRPFEVTATYDGIITLDWFVVGATGLQPPSISIKKDADGYTDYSNYKPDYYPNDPQYAGCTPSTESCYGAVKDWLPVISLCDGESKEVKLNSCTAEQIRWYKGTTLLHSGDTYEFEEAGKYYVELINQGGTYRDSVEVKVGLAPSVDFAILIEEQDKGFGYRFRPNMINAGEWEWHYGVPRGQQVDPAAHTWEEGYHYYKEEGEYEVCLTATNVECDLSTQVCKSIDVVCYAPLSDISAFKYKGLPVVDDTITVCEGDQGIISIDAVDNAAKKGYGWYGIGLASLSDTNFVERVFETSHWLKVEAYNVCGDKVTDSVFVKVNPAAVAEFEFERISGTKYKFEAEWVGDEGEVTYAWTVDGVSIGNTIYIEHEFDTDGEKEVTLTVISDCGVSEKTKMVGCTYPVVANAVITGTESFCGEVSCQSYTVAGISGAQAITWSASAGGVLCESNGNKATISFTQSSTITVVASNACGDATPVKLDVEVKPKPATSAIAGEAAPACAAQGIAYSVTGSAGSTYAWTVPNGATIVSGQGTSSINVDFGTTNGAVSVVETSAAGCVGEKKELTVILDGCALAANFSASAQTTCTGSEVTFTDLSTGVGPTTNYAWSFGEGATPATSTAKGPHKVTYSTTGTKTVKLVISVGQISEEHTAQITVGAKPVSPLVLDGPASLCAGESGVYKIDEVANATNYNWVYPSGATVTQNKNQLTVTLGASGGVVSVTPENTCGSGATVSKTVTRNTVPTTSAITGPASGYCEERFTYSVSGGVGSTYEWTAPNGYTIVSGAGTSSIVVELGTTLGDGTISVVETSAAGCVGQKISKTVTVDGCGLTANFTASTASSCVNTEVSFTGTSSASPNASYSWNFGEGATPATSFESHNGAPVKVRYATAGTKQVTLTVTDNGESDVKRFSLEIGVSPAIKGVISGPETVCKDATAQFGIQPVAGVTTYQWSATGGAVVTGTSASVSIKFGSANSKITVRAINACGNSAVVEKNVSVVADGLASVRIETPKTTIKEGERLTFEAVGENAGEGASYSWYVNDLFVGSGTEYSTATLKNGDKVKVAMLSTITCVIVKEVESEEVVIEVEELLPGEAFAGADIETCESFVTLDANTPACASGAGSGEWTRIKGSGSIIDPSNPKSLLSGLGAGENIFRWTVTCGGVSNFDDVSVWLTVPQVTITADKSEICEGSVVNFTATVSEAGANDSYEWRVNNVASGSGSSFSSSALTNGALVRLQYTSSRCAEAVVSNQVKMTVHQSPSASIAGSDINTDEPQATLKANNPTVGKGVWSVVSGAGTFVNASNFTTVVRNLQSGKNVFDWTITNGVCAPSTSRVTVTYGSAPVISGSITGPSNVSVGETVTYSVPTIPGATFTWSVPFGATIISGQGTNSIKVSFSNEVSGPVSVFATNQFGDGPAVSLPVMAVAGVVEPVIEGHGRVQPGETVTYSVLNPELYKTIKWTLPAGVSVFVEDEVGGTIMVTISSDFMGGSIVVNATSFANKVGTAKKDIVAGSAPVTEKIIGPAVVEGGNEYTYEVPYYEGSTYAWSVPEGAVIVGPSTGNKITVRFGPDVNGIVSVVETNNFGSAKSELLVSNVVGYSGAFAINLEVYPNPFASQATIRVNTPETSPISVSIVNEQGITVKESANYYTNQAIMLGAELNTGVYFVKVTMDNKTEVFKLVKIK